MKNFSIAQIEKAIAEAEHLNKGEILPVIVKSSSSYFYVSFVYAWVFLWIATALWFLYEYFFWGTFEDIFYLISLQFSVSFLGFLLGYWDRAVHFLVSAKSMALEVHESALAAFTEHGLGNTRDKTGILIYISILERRVEIIADEGIYKKVGKDFWQKEVENIIQGIRKGNLQEALIKEILNMGKKLREHFPQMDKNPNEISNRPKILT